MLARVHSAATLGIEAAFSTSKSTFPGLPRFTIVGLPDATRPGGARARPLRACETAVSRPVRSGHGQPRSRRLAKGRRGARPPGRASACSGSAGSSRPDRVRRVYVGELGLSGEVRAVRGALCLALAAREAGFEEILLPDANAPEAAAVEGIRVVAGRISPSGGRASDGDAVPPFPALPCPGTPVARSVDFADVRGQAVARRALEIAAAGGHHVLLAGPPGCGQDDARAPRSRRSCPPSREPRRSR